jgi:GNAT superfamily N-acetyltransferase
MTTTHRATTDRALLWRRALETDDEDVIAMCLALYLEDPGQQTVDRAQVLRTLTVLRAEPSRGRAVVAEVAGRVAAYSLLIPFWSNELGGSLCEVDELYVRPAFRNRGVASSLFPAIERKQIWDDPCAGVALIVTDGNERARSLYTRLGFDAVGSTMVHRFAN